LQIVFKQQQELLYSYEQDFKKYRPVVNDNCLNDILINSAKHVGNQTIYTKLSEGFSSVTVKKGVEVLLTAQLLFRINNVSIAGLPLSGAGKQFKLFYLDIGLLVCKAGLQTTDTFIRNTITSAFNGALAEQFVAQQLLAQNATAPSYWTRTENGASSEVDLVITKNNQIIPIEVKSGKSGSLKSLHYALRNNQHIKKAYVFSLAKKGVEGSIHFVPMIFAGRDFEENGIKNY
jgi:uncharacterized protein